MSRLDEMKKELAKKHAESEGDNGSAEISFHAGFDAGVEAQKEENENLKKIIAKELNENIFDFEGRYSEILKELLKELGAVKALEVKYEDNCQGFVDVSYLLSDGRVFSYYYDYGSCSGCDEWEHRELSDAAIKTEMKIFATFFDNIEIYNKYLKIKRDKNEPT